MRELKGKVAVVTGAASGIGRALADRFAREGMRIVMADVEERPLAEARAALASAGAEAIAVPTDVSQAAQVDALARRAIDEYGAVHVLCNNAGVAFGGLAWQVSREDWEWVLGVNLWGVVHGIRAFVPRMIEQGEGHVVNTASIAGLISAPGCAPYCATKHAVVGISEVLHYDLAMAAGGSVKVSVLCPSWVKTNIADAVRNRPAAAPGASAARKGRGPSQHDRMFDGLLRAAIAGGIEAHEVADQVADAIVNERFWVLTHPKTKRAVERRARGVVEGETPQFDLSKI
jgi:NAD(P)-dependent dehydrogenase (short-subunit alcohol dehydrogenase family)